MRFLFRAALAALAVAGTMSGCAGTPAVADRSAPLRVATYNVSLYAEVADGVRARLAGGRDAKAQR